MSKKNPAKVFHFDLYGKREEKYDFLNQESIESIQWKELEVKKPGFFFVEKDFEIGKEYGIGLNIDELFILSTSGIKTHDDENLVSINKFNDFNYRYSYRPFDNRFIMYDLHKVQRHRYSVMKHMVLTDNICLIATRQAITAKFGFFISKNLCDINFTGVAGQFGAGLVFPLFLYPVVKDQQTISQVSERTPNLNMDIVGQIDDYPITGNNIVNKPFFESSLSENNEMRNGEKRSSEINQNHHFTTSPVWQGLDQ